jgi:Ubinuclein conserved middle domain
VLPHGVRLNPVFVVFISDSVSSEKKQEKIKAETVEVDSASGDASVGGPAQPSVVDDTAASGTEQDAAPKSSATKESHPPAKKYRMTEPIKNIIWQLVCLSNECCRIENERK